MVCYLDRSFCYDADECANKEPCYRWFSPEHEERAKKWWGEDGAPVALMSFKKTCPDFVEVKE